VSHDNLGGPILLQPVLFARRTYLFVVDLEVGRSESVAGVWIIVHQVEQVVERTWNEAF